MRLPWRSAWADGASAHGAGYEAARESSAWRERPRKICGQKDTPTADGHVLVAAPAGYFAAFFLRSTQEAVIRSETAFFLFGRHRSALPRRLGVGRGLRDRGGRSRPPPRGGAPGARIAKAIAWLRNAVLG